ncbi:MAG: TraR/DksA family transcriptional regulator [Methylovulum sp.]|nr:TraR/DksA family transcriptional regulator [Methylovulum sp.]
MKNYAEVKQTLCEMLEELGGRLAKITDDVRHTDQPVEKDFAEQATQTENDQVLDYLGNAARAEVAQIKQAITRIDKGEYGLCEACGGPIREERLKALPYASLCIQCAGKIPR